MSDQQGGSFNRRESFRIDDSVSLTIRLLDEKSVLEITENFDRFRLRYCMKSHMQNQNNIRKPKLIRIRKRDSDVADYLESLEGQITLLAERLDQSSNDIVDRYEIKCSANISATGIRFKSSLEFKSGQIIEAGMVLSTDNTQVVMLGQITRVEQCDGEESIVSLRYTHIHPEDTEAVIRHLARLQQLELQARRGLD